MPDLPVALTDRVTFLMQLALGRAQAMGEEALSGLGLRGREYGALALLEHAALASQHELGATLGLDRTTTMTLIAGLESRGLVARTRDPADRRAYRITLTRSGDKLRARAATILADCEDRFLTGLPPADVTHLRRILATLTSPPA